MSLFLYSLYSLFFLVTMPFWRFIFLMNQTYRERFNFEEKNLIDSSCKSFKFDRVKADYAFEISSEGELEQIMPILEVFLSQKKKIEIVYCSDSVEGKCIQLYKKHPHQIRLLRLPIVTFIPFSRSGHSAYSWLTAPNLFLCRYDFFPELMLYGLKPGIKFILIWATLKNKDEKLKNIFTRIMLKTLYSLFDQIVTATEKDMGLMRQHFGFNDEKLKVYDFRPFQIAKRIEQRDLRLKKYFPFISSFMSVIEEVPKKKRLIWGNFWGDEAQVFEYALIKQLLDEKHLMVVVPHNVDLVTAEQNISIIKEKLLHSIPIYLIDQYMSKDDFEEVLKEYNQKPGILYLNLKGILVELYSYFHFAYVGGGYRSSVHSLLEPFVAGCRVVCGPKVARSTEYDFILERSPKMIHSFSDYPSLHGAFRQHNLIPFEEWPMKNYLDHFPEHIRWIQ